MDVKLKFVNKFNFIVLMFQCLWFLFILLLKPSMLFLVYQPMLILLAYGLCVFDQYMLLKNGNYRLNSYRRIVSDLISDESKFKDVGRPEVIYFLNPNKWLILVYEVKLPKPIIDYVIEKWDMIIWCEKQTEYSYAFRNRPQSDSILFQSKEDAVRFILRWGSEL